MKPVYWGHVASRLRDDAAMWYSYDSIRTDKRGRPRIKGEKIDFANLFSIMRLSALKEAKAYSINAYFKAVKRNISVLHYLDSERYKIYLFEYLP